MLCQCLKIRAGIGAISLFVGNLDCWAYSTSGVVNGQLPLWVDCRMSHNRLSHPLFKIVCASLRRASFSFAVYHHGANRVRITLFPIRPIDLTCNVERVDCTVYYIQTQSSKISYSTLPEITIGIRKGFDEKCNYVPFCHLLVQISTTCCGTLHSSLLQTGRISEQRKVLT